MRRAALALTALLLAAAPAAAQQKMSWYATETDQGGALVFGVPDSEDALLFFLCERGADTMVAQSLIGSKELEKDGEAQLVLSSGGVKKTFAGKGVPDEKVERIDVEAAGKLADLRALLKTRGPLNVEVKGATQKIALTGAAAALTAFESYCKKPKS